MDAIAYAATSGAVRATDGMHAPARQRRGWFMRFMTALHETRGQQAAREIRKHAHLLQHQSDEEGG